MLLDPNARLLVAETGTGTNADPATGAARKRNRPPAPLPAPPTSCRPDAPPHRGPRPDLDRDREAHRPSGTGAAGRGLPALAALEHVLGVDTRRRWTPSRDALFARMTKAQLLDVGETDLRDGFAEDMKTMKKDALVEHIDSIWTRADAELTDDERTFRECWAPAAIGGPYVRLAPEAVVDDENSP